MVNHPFRRNTATRLIYLFMVIPAILIVLLVNFFAGLLVDRFDLRVDLTPNSAFALSQTTIEYLETVDTNISIQVLATQSRFEGNSNYNAQAGVAMSLFAQSNDLIDFAYVDYVKDPTFSIAYPDYDLKEGDIIVSSPTQSRHIQTQELFNYVQGADGSISIVSSKAEQVILSGILAVLSTDLPQIAILTGHGERVPAAFLTMLTENNFGFEPLQLSTQELSPDVDVVLICAPVNDYALSELEALDDFLTQNGDYGKTLIYTANAAIAPLPAMEAFLAEWGIVVGDGVVFETDENRAYDYNPFSIVADYADTIYTDLLRNQDVPFLAPNARPLTASFETSGQRRTEVLLTYGESAGVRPADSTNDFTSDDATWWGPIPALILSSHQIRDNQNATIITAQSHVLVAGSTDMLDQTALFHSAFGNTAYLVSLLNELCQRENLGVVAPKELSGAPLVITQQTADTLGIVFAVIIPVAIMGFGILIWLRRRFR